MNKKILQPLFLALLLVIFYPSLSISQNVIRFNPDRVSREATTLYKEHFKEFSVGSLATEDVSKLLRSRDYFENLQIEVEGKTFSFSLESRDIRPAHYKLRYQDANGVHEMPRTPNKTYSRSEERRVVTRQEKRHT